MALYDPESKMKNESKKKKGEAKDKTSSGFRNGAIWRKLTHVGKNAPLNWLMERKKENTCLFNWQINNSSASGENTEVNEAPR